MNEPPASPANTLTRYVLAIDGGGSKVSGLLAIISEDVRPQYVLRHTIEGTGSAAPTTWPTARVNLLQLIEEILVKAQVEPSSISKVILMLAGAGRAADVERVRQFLTESDLLKSVSCIVITSDVQPLLAYAFNKQPKLPTIVVISGTGSIVASLDSQQQMVRAGGWGPVLGDEASGFRIAQMALTTVCHWVDAEFPKEPWSPIAKKALDFLIHSGLLAGRDAGDRPLIATALLKLVDDRHATARFAPLVLDHCDSHKTGELTRQVGEQFAKLANQVAVVLRKSSGSSETAWRLGLAGGLAVHHPVFRKYLIEQLEKIAVVPTEVFELDPLTAAIATS
jgi:N-acetylglucosamine kinase-like BadF-type ATPase